jgi:hypothetical protein
MSTLITISKSSTPTPPPVGATLMQTGQTTIFRTGDDADRRAEGRDVDFFTLPSNNPFGNTNRFTDELGGQTYTNNWVIDWSTYNGSNVLGYFRTIQLASVGAWNQAIDDSLSNTYGTFSGCRLPNINEYTNIVKWSDTSRFFDYAPFNFGLNVYLWSSTTANSGTTNAYAIGFSTSATVVLPQNKANTTPRFIPVRTFTVTGTTLT